MELATSMLVQLQRRSAMPCRDLVSVGSIEAYSFLTIVLLLQYLFFMSILRNHDYELRKRKPPRLWCGFFWVNLSIPHTGTDEDQVLVTVSSLSNEQRQEVATAFKQAYGKVAFVKKSTVFLCGLGGKGARVPQSFRVGFESHSNDFDPWYVSIITEQTWKMSAKIIDCYF